MPLTRPSSSGFLARPHRRRVGQFAYVLAAVALLCSCTVLIVSGPTSVAIGETVIYVLELGNDQMGGDSEATVVVDVPEGWDLVSSTYEVVVDGERIEGEGTLVETTV